MFVLAIDTATAAVTAGVVLVDESGLTRGAEVRHVDARAHGEMLAPLIRDCLQNQGIRQSDLGAIVVGLGPGPFTGLRVGLVTAEIMADLLAVPVYGVCSLDGIGAALADQPELIVATDARRKEVYWARYQHGVRVDGPNVDRPATIDVGDAAITGSGATLYAEVFRREPLHIEFPAPDALVSVASDRIRAGEPGEPLTPLYLRRPDAQVPGKPKAVSQ